MTIYLPSLLDKFKDFVNGIRANWEEYEAHVAATPEDDVHGLAGAVIVDAGSNDDGSWVRFGNGLQVCWGSKTFPGEGWSGSGDKWYLTGQSLNFPVTFDSAPIFLGTARDSSVGARSAKLAFFEVGTSKVSDIAFSGWGTISGSFYLHWVAIGWWK